MQDYQQSAEYALPALLRPVLGGGCVVDVGAELGGFTAACRDAGWQRIEAFEPLPRHVDSLRARFRGEPSVRIHQVALSDRNGFADLKIATNDGGCELDYHHTLADMQDTETVFFARTERVAAMTLPAAVSGGLVPERPDILKLDTEGHDFAIVQALGNLRPRVLMCEFWCDLPKTSGRCPYSLRELVAACRRVELPHLVSFRHRDGQSWMDIDDACEKAGEWGNAVFVCDEAWQSGVGHILCGMAAEASRKLIDGIEGASRELHAKEAVIRELAVAAQQRLEIIEGMSGRLGE